MSNKNEMKLDKETALKLYPTAAAEFKELLEENFGKEFFNQNITDKVKDYGDILHILNVDDKKDIIQIEGFDEGDHNFIKNIIKKVRINKVYNENYVFKKEDKRYYPWYDVSSGFVFDFTSYVVTVAHTGSASRLSLKSADLVRDAAKKFKDIDEAIIDVK